MNLLELASHIGAEIHAPAETDLSRPLTGMQTVENASDSEVTFLTNPRFREKLDSTRAAAVILAERIDGLPLSQLVHRNPYAAMAKASRLFFQYEHAFSGQSELAFIHPKAKVHPSATVYPFAYIDADSEVSEGCIIYPHCYIGVKAKIGDRSILFAGATVMFGCEVGRDNLLQPGSVIGGDGFGFAPTRDGIEKVAQIGAVRLAEDVEIGSNTTVDRGGFNDTTLARGCKLDSHVHVGHGSQMGEYSMICGLGGLAGSVKTGKRYIGAGHSGVAPGLELPDNVTAGAMCGIISPITEPGEYIGMPAVPASDWRRQTVATAKLPELLKTIRNLTARLEVLEGKSLLEQ